MTASVLPRPHRRAAVSSGGHADWCARGHYCAFGEHRAVPITLTVPGRGTVVLTRVRDRHGRQHVEITTSVTLADGEPNAQEHLAHILIDLEAQLRRIVRPPR